MKSKGKEAIRAIAAQNGISMDEVRKEITKSIKDARRNAGSSALEFRTSIKEDITPQEFIELMAFKICTKK